MHTLLFGMYTVDQTSMNNISSNECRLQKLETVRLNQITSLLENNNKLTFLNVPEKSR